MIKGKIVGITILSEKRQREKERVFFIISCRRRICFGGFGACLWLRGELVDFVH